MMAADPQAVTMPVPAAGGAARQAAGLPRLLPPVPGKNEDLHTHLARFGRLPRISTSPSALIDAAEQAGLTGRGGAAFPVYRKLAVVSRAPGRKVVVANGAEGEPASRKDAALLWHAPHLVLDGLQLAGDAVGADQVVLYLHRGQQEKIARALHERTAAGLDQHPVTIRQAPPRFLAGQETALVNHIEGGPALPTFTPLRVPERGIAVHNVETLAHLALIGRYGPGWFREVGTETEPGTMLATIHRGDRPEVVEAPLGTPLRAILGGTPSGQAVLIGGYHGTWLPASGVDQHLTLDNHSLKRYDATLGAGVIAVLPDDVCGLREAARVTRYLAAESAGQCGPCLNGLPRIAVAMAELAGPSPRRRTLEDTKRWAGLVTGRGACHHPDGTVRFVRSALKVFGGELKRHADGRCSATFRKPFLPLPDAAPTSEEDWI